MNVVRMNRYGQSLFSGQDSRKRYREILAEVEKGEVMFDFSGVRAMGSRFADEVFGRMVFEKGAGWVLERVRFGEMPKMVSTALWKSLGLKDSQDARARGVLIQDGEGV